jgi:hypothetical protein
VNFARRCLFLVLPLLLVFDLLFALFLMMLMVLSMMIHDYSREMFFKGATGAAILILRLNVPVIYQMSAAGEFRSYQGVQKDAIG